MIVQNFRDKDGYHWLTGRVDDVINVRYSIIITVLLFIVIFHVSFNVDHSKKRYISCALVIFVLYLTKKKVMMMMTCLR